MPDRPAWRQLPGPHVRHVSPLWQRGGDLKIASSEYCRAPAQQPCTSFRLLVQGRAQGQACTMRGQSGSKQKQMVVPVSSVPAEKEHL